MLGNKKIFQATAKQVLKFRHPNRPARSPHMGHHKHPHKKHKRASM